MTQSLRFKDSELLKYLSLAECRVVRDTRTAEGIGIVEPAKPCYGPPPEGEWRNIHPGEFWGAEQQWAWFRATLEAPKQWPEGEIELQFKNTPNYLERTGEVKYPAGPEGQIFIDGRRVGAIDREHDTIRYAFQPGQRYELRAVFFAARCECKHRLEALGLAWVHGGTERLYHDLRVASDVALLLDENSIARHRLTDAVEVALKALDLRTTPEWGETPDAMQDPFYDSVKVAQAAFDNILSALEPAGNRPEVVALGHSHIDLAWLWPIRQTHHKCLRTFATQCRLLDQYPDWVFQQSSPQAYAWVERDAPELFEEVCKRIQAGRWEPSGAMWVEADTNISGGEALVRQLLYGKRYFMDRFGKETRILWLPDVFGYSAAIPQLLRLAGVEGFVTNKISWNQFNRFPNDTFRWRGLDGSEIVAHFITTPCEYYRYNYNGFMRPWEVMGIWREYRQKAIPGLQPLLTFGFGDGGGGPTEEMLQTAQRLTKWEGITAFPKIKFDTSESLLERVIAKRSSLPVWDGELYLELHRGTYTTQGWLKRANRKNETRLHQFEWLAAQAIPLGYQLDKTKLDALWQDLLLCQFHDILPGSSVTEVYDEVRPLQQTIADTLDEMIAGVMDFLSESINTMGAQSPAILFNTLGWDFTAPIRMPDGQWRDDLSIPSGGWLATDTSSKPEPSPDLQVSGDGCLLENSFWRIQLNDKGYISELFDKQNNRQVLAPGAQGNQWQVFEDRPVNSDAWDIDVYFEEHPLPGPEFASVRVVEQGPCRVAVEIAWEMPSLPGREKSTLVQRMAIYARSPRIDFETVVDWHEHHQLLKLAFPVAVRSLDATYQVQFGHVRKPTHKNTTWDIARFENCAHRFVDLSEHGYGVALLNDCKYGHDIRENTIRLTCIKCPQSPDPTADQGRHEFNYALLPHAGTFQEAGVIRAAAEFNIPVLARKAKPAKGRLSNNTALVRSNHPAAAIETVKPAEDGSGIIVRLYESFGSHASVVLDFGKKLKSVQCVDLLERSTNDGVELHSKGSEVSLRLSPFQIVSLRVLFT